MDVFEAIATTRAMRRLDPDRSVAEEDIWRVVEAATKAPSGGNAQPVRWTVVTDAERRRQLGEIYAECWKPVHDRYASAAGGDERMSRVLRSADHLGDHMGDAPVIVLPCSKGGDPASVFPACQNLFLAARAIGLGTTLTTVHRLNEQGVRDVLGIPDDVTVWAMIPMGYPLGNWGEAQRRPVEDVTYWDAYGEARRRP